MPNRFRPKLSVTSLVVPQPANLIAGELALNAADGKLFTKKFDGTVVQIPELPVFPQGAIVGTTDAQTLTNKTVTGGVISRIVESSNTVTATAGALTVNLNNSSVFRTTNLTGATTLTISNVGAQLVADGQIFTLSVISVQTASTAFINAVTITGATTTTVRWHGGAAPVAGSASPARDWYSFSIIRTASGVYDVLASKAGQTGVRYPLSNTSVNPTSATWRANNPGYTFIPNVGINTVSPMTNATSMFSGNTTFNDPDISTWDVSSVTSMENMFDGCSAFNQPLNSWNVSSVTNMSFMFDNCSAFDQSLSNWDVSSVTFMSYMFWRCTSFNQPLNNWNVSSVTTMAFMFFGCTSFNQSLSNWNVASVTRMENMFNGCSAFNQALNNWNVASVTRMDSMFSGCSAFNQALNNWNVSRVTQMDTMFSGCSAFNQSLENWNVSRVTTMDAMFIACTAFNCGQASGVAHNLMQRTSTAGWRVNNVTDMDGMFNGAAAFNGNISNWCVSLIATAPTFFATNANPNFTTSRRPTWGRCPFP